MRNIYRVITRKTSAGIATLLVAALVAVPITAGAIGLYPSDFAAPNPVSLLAGYSSYWAAGPDNTLHGQVLSPAVLQRNDQLTAWINRNATSSEQFLALQDSEYQNSDGTAYDQSFTIATGLGSVLGDAYLDGRESGALPLTAALINSSNGDAGAYVSTSGAKAIFSYPRPYLVSDPSSTPVAGDSAACALASANASSLAGIRVGQPYSDARGNLAIVRVSAATDTTRQFSTHDVALDAGYGNASLCLGGSFPSGHTTTAYEAGLTLATLLPELAPEILARASENGNSRIVLGVHYPLDVMGGRIAGEAALATRWSDPKFRAGVLKPARAELLSYLRKVTGHTLKWNIAHQKPYRSNPYGGAQMPGGSAQIVVNRTTALAVYTERMTYGFARSGVTGLAASVPAGASNLLRTTFPSLTDAQRTSVLAQTEIASGYPLDQSGTPDGSWQRLNLAAAMSATVRLSANGDANVILTGGTARVLRFRA